MPQSPVGVPVPGSSYSSESEVRPILQIRDQRLYLRGELTCLSSLVKLEWGAGG